MIMAHGQDDLHLRILSMFEGTFSLINTTEINTYLDKHGYIDFFIHVY